MAPFSMPAPGTPALVQSVIGANAATSTVFANWPGPTTAGHLLVMIVVAAGGSGVTFTTPGGWTLVGTVDNGTNVKVGIYYIENASLHSGTQSLTMSGSAQAIMTLAEYSGIITSGSLEGNSSATGTSTAPGSGSYTTTRIHDLVVTGIGMGPSGLSPTLSGLTNGWTEERTLDAGSPHFVAVLGDTVAVATGAQSTAEGLGASDTWAGVIAAFKAA